MAFHGTFDHTLDAKNRVTIPARFRLSLADGVVLAPGTDECVRIISPETYDAQIARSLSGRNPLAPETIKLKRALHRHSFEDKLDAAGRVTVPAPLIDHARLRKEVLVIGTGDAIELWDPEALRVHDADPDNSLTNLSARLGHPA